MSESLPSADHSDEDATPDAPSPADIRLAAMNLLARREHSVRELRNKLKRRFTDESVIDEQLQRLAEERLQSDARFAESYARQRADKGYGPVRLREELRERGISDADTDLALDEMEIDWRALAAQVMEKKFGVDAPKDIKERAQRARFMQYRGFSSEHYRSARDD